MSIRQMPFCWLRLTRNEVRQFANLKAAMVGELHEGLSNFLMITVRLHVEYLFAFKRPLVGFILFIATPKRRQIEPGRAP